MREQRSLLRRKMAFHILPGILAILCIFAANALALDESGRIRELERKLEEQGATINRLEDMVKGLNDRNTGHPEEAKRQGAYTILTKPVDLQLFLSFLSILRKDESEEISHNKLRALLCEAPPLPVNRGDA